MAHFDISKLTILCINLPKDIERKQNVQMQAAREGLDIEYMEAVYGKGVSKKERAESTTVYWNKFAHASVLGCAMSHVKAWKIAKERDLDYCLFLEDDVEFVRGFKLALTNVFRELEDGFLLDFDIMYVGSNYFEPEKSMSFGWWLYRQFVNVGQSLQIQKTQKVWQPKLCLGLHAYILTRNGYNKLLSAIEGQISFHIDYQVQRVKNLKVLAIWEPLATQVATVKTSTLQGQPFPQAFNRVIDLPVKHGFSPAYILNCPIAQIGKQNINYWTLIALICSIIFVVFDIRFPNVCYIFFGFLALNFSMMEPDETIKLLPESVTTILWLFALLVFPSLFMKTIFGPKIIRQK
jgi:GR25 family glycosyltransferase involved in LPS biosynthesis